MTVALYARRKSWPLQEVTVRLRHSSVHAQDCRGMRNEGRAHRPRRVVVRAKRRLD